jgi:hypothetical protein
MSVVLPAVACSPFHGSSGPAAIRSHWLFLAGGSELWMVDTVTGRVRHEKNVPELSPGDPPYRILRRGDRLVSWSGATYVRTFDLRKPARVLAADGGIFIPSVRNDRVWLGIFDPKSNARLAAVREVTVAGKVTVPDVRPPRGSWPEGAVTDGLLIPRRSGVEVWNPVTRKALRRLPIRYFPGTPFGNVVPSCSVDCRQLVLTDAHTGDRTIVQPPSGYASFDATSGAFSPDGSLLAVPVATERSRSNQNRWIDLALVDVRSRQVRIVGGSRVRPGYNLVTWASAGDTVFFTGGDRFKKRVVKAYGLGRPEARIVYSGRGDFHGIAAR